MNRLQAYLIIALIGYVVGVVFYYLGKITGEFIGKIIPRLTQILEQPQISGLLISGLTGMIIALVLAYLWAERSERYNI